jgi:hypothetical protein
MTASEPSLFIEQFSWAGCSTGVPLLDRVLGHFSFFSRDARRGSKATLESVNSKADRTLRAERNSPDERKEETRYRGHDSMQ